MNESLKKKQWTKANKERKVEMMMSSKKRRKKNAERKQRIIDKRKECRKNESLWWRKAKLTMTEGKLEGSVERK